MCGIVGYLGKDNAIDIILKSLKTLEYRGYDSSGIAVIGADETIKFYKKEGKVKALESLIKRDHNTCSSYVGIGHTRWATHGEPNYINAHPHLSPNNKIAVIHNGIIENYAFIKKTLIKKGYIFKSDTDTEVIPYFIEYILATNKDYTLEDAIRVVFKQIIGAYAIIIYSVDEPRRLYALRNSSPLVIGMTKNNESFFVSSDAVSIIPYTKDVIYINDMEMAILDDENKTISIKSLKNGASLTPNIQTLDMDIVSIEKNSFETFMMKEIFEQPQSILDSMRGRISFKNQHLVLGGIRSYVKTLVEAKRIIIIGCGTSWHAGLIAEYLIEEWVRIPVEVEYASEFRYRNPIIGPGDVVIAVSQSGETADTLAAVKLAKSKGAVILGVCNVVGSSLARISHAGIYTHAGPEIGVASTKAFSTQLIVLSMMALLMAKKRKTLDKKDWLNLLKELESIPQKIEVCLNQLDEIKKIAFEYYESQNFLYLGRGVNFPLALEGALKLKEISYIHAEGYPAAEMKHGPIALIDHNMPSVFIATGKYINKVISNIQEVKARQGKVIAIIDEQNKDISSIVDHVIKIPSIDESLVPIIAVVPLQLLSYYIARLQGKDVDQPRNLAKSVTVE